MKGKQEKSFMIKNDNISTFFMCYHLTKNMKILYEIWIIICFIFAYTCKEYHLQVLRNRCRVYLVLIERETMYSMRHNKLQFPFKMNFFIICLCLSIFKKYVFILFIIQWAFLFNFLGQILGLSHPGFYKFLRN